MVYELELEELEDLMEMTKENAKNILVFIGRMTTISEPRIGLSIDVNIKTMFDGESMIIRYIKHVGEAFMQTDEVKTLEENFEKEALKIKAKLESNGYNVYSGVFKTV